MVEERRIRVIDPLLKVAAAVRLGSMNISGDITVPDVEFKPRVRISTLKVRHGKNS